MGMGSRQGIAASWEVCGSWDGPVPKPTQPTVTSETSPRLTIIEATEAFWAKCQNRGIRPPTYAKYKTFATQLRAYCPGVSDMDRFYASWEDGNRAKAKKLERLKSFVKFALKRKWITEDLTEDLGAPEGSSIINPKSPFTVEELNRIFAACDQIGPAPGPPRRTWGGEDAKDFIYLSIYTGLRISDVATFDITKRLQGNDVFLRMHKTRKPLYSWIPDWLVERLKARHGPLIFKYGVTHNMKQLTDIWRNKRLKQVFNLAGPWDEKPSLHRFRATFVRILLQNGVSVQDAAELIGDTPKILLKHYAKWVPTRQTRLTHILKEAFAGQPAP